ncbi:MAG: hypothetical protein HYV35_11395 [Lentisphaerae bacterium]|nr:hypothetical protein [Lentisphaerota bacterium]
MKKADSLATIEKTLQNDPATRRAFLGSDKRSLAEILRADAAIVRRRGLNHARIAQRMLALRQAGWSGQGEVVAVPPHFAVKVEAERGYLACPFGDEGAVAKVNTTVRNLARGLEITFSNLNIHLIAAHRFYEGRGAKFRLDPGQLIETLAISRRVSGAASGRHR